MTRWGHIWLAVVFVAFALNAAVVFVAWPSVAFGALGVAGSALAAHALFRAWTVASALTLSREGLRARTFIGRDMSLTWPAVSELQRWPWRTFARSEYLRVVSRDGCSITLNSLILRSSYMTLDEFVAEVRIRAPEARVARPPRLVRFLTTFDLR